MALAAPGICHRTNQKMTTHEGWWSSSIGEKTLKQKTDKNIKRKHGGIRKFFIIIFVYHEEEKKLQRCR
jgi:hypothetical protein